MRRLLILAVATLLAAGAAQADVIHLKGGGRVEGEVVEQRPDRVVIEVPAGRVTLPRSQIEKMVLGSSSLAEYRARAARLAWNDVEGWLALGAWARENELLTQSRAAYEHVLSLQPDNAAAHQALGHVFMAGRWQTLDESYRARGYVQFEGNWVRPEERQAMLEERSAYAAERRERLEAEARLREAEARARTAEAEARRAEADEQQTNSDGFPYPYVFGGGGVVVPVEVAPTPPPPPPVVIIQVPSRPQRDGNHGRSQSPPPSTRPVGIPAGREGQPSTRDH